MPNGYTINGGPRKSSHTSMYSAQPTSTSVIPATYPIGGGGGGGGMIGLGGGGGGSSITGKTNWSAKYNF